MERRLTLRREALTDLTAGELHGVVGGALPTSPIRACMIESYAELVCINESWACPTETV